MAKTEDIDIIALSTTLAAAKLRVDGLLERLSGKESVVSAIVASRLRAADDNNSSCNTACSCGGGGGGGGGGGNCVALGG